MGWSNRERGVATSHSQSHKGSAKKNNFSGREKLFFRSAWLDPCNQKGSFRIIPDGKCETTIFQSLKNCFFRNRNPGRTPAPCSQPRERIRRQNSSEARDLRHNDCRRRVLFCATSGVCQYVVFLVCFLLPFTITPRMDFEWTGSSPSMCEKNWSLQKLFLCKAYFIPKGVIPQKGSRKGELQPYSSHPTKPTKLHV